MDAGLRVMLRRWGIIGSCIRLTRLEMVVGLAQAMATPDPVRKGPLCRHLAFCRLTRLQLEATPEWMPGADSWDTEGGPT